MFMFYDGIIFLDLMNVVGVIMLLSFDLVLVNNNESVDFGGRYFYMDKMGFYFGFNGLDYFWG